MIRHFERRNPLENMARFYRLELRPTLFGEWSVVRLWGRIGTGGREQLETHATWESALAAANRLERAKRGRGYMALKQLE